MAAARQNSLILSKRQGDPLAGAGLPHVCSSSAEHWMCVCVCVCVCACAAYGCGVMWCAYGCVYMEGGVDQVITLLRSIGGCTCI